MHMHAHHTSMTFYIDVSQIPNGCEHLADETLPILTRRVSIVNGYATNPCILGRSNILAFNICETDLYVISKCYAFEKTVTLLTMT